MSGPGVILAPLDAETLQSQGLLHPGSTTGTHRLHRRRVTEYGDVEYKHIPLDVPLQSPLADEAYVTIPQTLISRQTLAHIGLSDSKATELWHRWGNWPADGPSPVIDGPGRAIDADDDEPLEAVFLGFVIHLTKREPDVDDESDDVQWRSYLDACGISHDVQDAIMDPHFTDIRLSNSCWYWIQDTIEMRYAGLQDIQHISLAREMQLRKTASQSGRREGNSGGQNTTTGLSSPPMQGGQGPAGVSVDVWGSARAIAARNAPGHTVLYKGMDKARVTGLLDETGALSGSITKLLSTPPADFSSRWQDFYFTPSYQVAERYAIYAKRRVTCESVVIVCFCIKNAAVDALGDAEIQRVYWPSGEWKQLIWYCQRNEALPSSLIKYRKATLVIGTISRKPSHAYHQLESWEHISGNHVLMVGAAGQEQLAGVQYVFSGREDGENFLLENGLRESIKVFPLLSRELE
ncbi:hypothetical protein C8A01DRAFT_20795 [Parachaetomium inaequale]|uniref:Uncharacterized protein n=1 Tax=Parachaetomium inaequale TaxID=2588326 RepID=A0AAN6P828_9PEZI|nr:hypothetical protein C8A01DRAFT_20795 [Parachaetomium inaequale]